MYPQPGPHADHTAPIPIVYQPAPPGYIYAPPQYVAQPKPPTNVAAIVAITAGTLGLLFNLLVIPGLVAVIAGLIGHRQALKEGRGLAKLALGGLLLGVLALTAVAFRVAQ